jgi:hypothetical protein
MWIFIHKEELIGITRQITFEAEPMEQTRETPGLVVGPCDVS